MGKDIQATVQDYLLIFFRRKVWTIYIPLVIFLVSLSLAWYFRDLWITYECKASLTFNPMNTRDLPSTMYNDYLRERLDKIRELLLPPDMVPTNDQIQNAWKDYVRMSEARAKELGTEKAEKPIIPFLRSEFRKEAQDLRHTLHFDLLRMLSDVEERGSGPEIRPGEILAVRFLPDDNTSPDSFLDGDRGVDKRTDLPVSPLSLWANWDLNLEAVVAQESNGNTEDTQTSSLDAQGISASIWNKKRQNGFSPKEVVYCSFFPDQFMMMQDWLGREILRSSRVSCRLDGSNVIVDERAKSARAQKATNDLVSKQYKNIMQALKEKLILKIAGVNRLEVSCDAKDPKAAWALVKTVRDRLAVWDREARRIMIEERTSSVQQELSYWKDQVVERQRRLDDAGEALSKWITGMDTDPSRAAMSPKDVLKNYMTTVLKQKDKAELQKEFLALQERLDSKNREIAAKEEGLRVAEEDLLKLLKAPNEESEREQERNPAFIALESDLSKMQAQLNKRYADGCGPNHPDVLDLKRDLRAKQQQLKQTPEFVEKSRKSTVRPEKGFAQTEVNQLRRTLAECKAEREQLLDLVKGIHDAFVSGKGIEQKQEERSMLRAEMEKATQTVNQLQVKFNDLYTTSKILVHKYNPGIIYNENESLKGEYKETSPVLKAGVATVIAFIICLIAVFFLEYSDHSIKSIEDAKRWLEMPLLGTIPDFRQNQGHRPADMEPRRHRGQRNNAGGHAGDSHVAGFLQVFHRDNPGVFWAFVTILLLCIVAGCIAAYKLVGGEMPLEQKYMAPKLPRTVGYLEPGLSKPEAGVPLLGTFGTREREQA